MPTPDFSHPVTRVRINPETYIKFDGTEHVLLRNVHSEDGVRIKYDILLILYELVDWKTVGELTAPWPPDDREKIVHHLGMLHSRHIVVTDDWEILHLPESGLSGQLGQNIHINVENHHAMLRDYVRVAAYQRAIERAVTPESSYWIWGADRVSCRFSPLVRGRKKCTPLSVARM